MTPNSFDLFVFLGWSPLLVAVGPWYVVYFFRSGSRAHGFEVWIVPSGVLCQLDKILVPWFKLVLALRRALPLVSLQVKE